MACPWLGAASVLQVLCGGSVAASTWSGLGASWASWPVGRREKSCFRSRQPQAQSPGWPVPKSLPSGCQCMQAGQQAGAGDRLEGGSSWAS